MWMARIDMRVDQYGQSLKTRQGGLISEMIRIRGYMATIIWGEGRQGAVRRLGYRILCGYDISYQAIPRSWGGSQISRSITVSSAVRRKVDS